MQTFWLSAETEREQRQRQRQLQTTLLPAPFSPSDPGTPRTGHLHIAHHLIDVPVLRRWGSRGSYHGHGGPATAAAGPATATAAGQPVDGACQPAANPPIAPTNTTACRRRQHRRAQRQREARRARARCHCQLLALHRRRPPQGIASLACRARVFWRRRRAAARRRRPCLQPV